MRVNLDSELSEQEKETARKEITKHTGKYIPCANCGLTFYVPSYSKWGWKFAAKSNSKVKYFCTYHCMREWEREQRRKGLL